MTEAVASMQTAAGRLASFQSEQPARKRRVSSQKKKPQTNSAWPHESPAPEDLARAGFFYDPVTGSDDNVKCFKCRVKLDGWDPSDDPISEHLAHSPQCTWALCTSVGRPGEERDPATETMLEARKDTYGETWPHEGKKGWKCKMGKMVEAGWCYDPSPEAEDGVTCFYCSLSLDGWEPKDNPLEEHRRRSPQCPFFALSAEYAADHIKPAARGKGRASRGSKASRLSTQSMQSTFSEAPSLMSLGDAASTMDVDDSVATVATTTSTADKPKKRAAAKPRAPAKGKKQAVKEESVEPSVLYPSLDQSVQEALHVDHPVADSLVDESTLGKPATKSKRGKGKQAVKAEPEESEEQSQLQSELLATAVEPVQNSAPAKSKRGVKRTSDGIEKGEDMTTIGKEDVSSQKTKKETKQPRKKKAQASVDDTVDHQQEELSQTVIPEVIEPQPASPPVKAKKERKTKKQLAEEAARLAVEQEMSAQDGSIDDSSEANFVVHGTTPEPEEFEPTPTPQKPAVVMSGSPSRVSKLQAESMHSTPQSVRSYQSSNAENHPPPSTARAPRTGTLGVSAEPTFAAPAQILLPTATVTHMSPAKTTRVALAASTPNHSPSRQTSPQKTGQLKTSTPWTATDLETIFFPSPEMENVSVGIQVKLLEVGGGLSSPEKKMSVEDWVRWRAAQGEERLKQECERMVSLFEMEGTRGLRALAGIEATS